MLSILLSLPIEILEKIPEKVMRKAEESLELLAARTHAHIIEQASEKLHSTKEEFIKSLSLELIGDRVWAINIPDEMMWIENGLPSNFDMLPGLLASPKAKQGKNGKYIVIPFKHNKSGGNKTPLQQVLVSHLKKEMETRKIPFNEIERNSAGEPRLGLLHKFNVHPTSAKDSGFPLLPSSKETGKPYLHGVRVYQRQVDGAKGKEIKRDILTFRTASQNSKGWKHPGIEANGFLDEASEWAKSEWERTVLPEILSYLD